MAVKFYGSIARVTSARITPAHSSHTQTPSCPPAAKKPSVPEKVSCLGVAALRVSASALMKALRAAMSSPEHPGHLQAQNDTCHTYMSLHHCLHEARCMACMGYASQHCHVAHVCCRMAVQLVKASPKARRHMAAHSQSGLNSPQQRSPGLIEEVVANDGRVVLVGHTCEAVDTAGDCKDMLLQQLQHLLVPGGGQWGGWSQAQTGILCRRGLVLPSWVPLVTYRWQWERALTGSRTAGWEFSCCGTCCCCCWVVLWKPLHHA